MNAVRELANVVAMLGLDFRKTAGSVLRAPTYLSDFVQFMRSSRMLKSVGRKGIDNDDPA
jgi:hypothetical protein